MPLVASDACGVCSYLHSETRANGLDFAMRAVRLARKTTPAAMPDEPVAEQSPLLARHQVHQVLLDFFRRLLPCQTKPRRKPRHVRINHDTDVNIKCISQDDVRGLTAHAGEGGEFFHSARDRAVMSLEQLLTTCLNAFRLVPKKAQPADFAFQFCEAG